MYVTSPIFQYVQLHNEAVYWYKKFAKVKIKFTLLKNVFFKLVEISRAGYIGDRSSMLLSTIFLGTYLTLFQKMCCPDDPS